jgi:HAE1 family hydrophobic/amphiphilic exporter-1
VTLIANSTQDFDTLTAVARDIEEHLRTIEGTRNVNNSAQTTPGQFSFSYNQAALQQLGLTAGQVSSGLFGAIFGVDAGAIPGAQDDIDIRVVYDEYIDGITPSAIEQVSIALPNGQQVAARDVMTYSLQESVDSFRREDGNIVVNVDADVTQDVAASIPQAALIDFVESYDFPPNITYSAGGETNENADIIQATTTGAIISLMVIYTILVLQFNSLRQPVFIIYSIFVALLGSNIGLRLTGNPYSMSFGIGFIALMGIVVNDAIVLMDRINYNRARGMTKHNAIVEAGQSRLQPILLTTITTIV